jgi:phosphoglucosamine mutase
MARRGVALGGEQSGHIILADHLFTGDGMATALTLLRIMADTGRELDELAGALVTYPHVLVRRNPGMGKRDCRSGEGRTRIGCLGYLECRCLGCWC